MSVKDVVTLRFAELCKDRNIKLNELATRAGVTPSTVYSMMDVNRRDVSIVTVKKTVRRFGYHIGRVFLDTRF